jgi:hypothetical protein
VNPNWPDRSWGLQDDAGLLKPGTVEKADRLLRDLSSRYAVNVRIETFSSLPDGQAGRLTSEFERDRFLTAWVRRNARRGDYNDIYLLICRQPAEYRIEVNTIMLGFALHPHERDELDRIVRRHLTAGDHDAGVLRVIEYLQERVATNVPHRLTASPAGPVRPAWHSWLFFGTLALMGAWIVLGLRRTLRQRAETMGLESVQKL